MNSVFSDLLADSKINDLSSELYIEFTNRNLFPLRDFSRFASYTDSALSSKCGKLLREVQEVVFKVKLDDIELNEDTPKYLKYALSSSKFDRGVDPDIFSRCLASYLLNRHQISLDEHVDLLTKDLSGFNIAVNKDFLVQVNHHDFALKSQGIIYKDEHLLYPHQFFRRCFNSNFLGVPALLSKAVNSNLDVYIKIDPLRITESGNYFEMIELDHWFGPPFTESVLTDKHLKQVTRHISTGLYDLNSEVSYTIFRTSMMDANLRQFFVEEYCPLIMTSGGGLSPGTGSKYVIQRFAHLCFDQEVGAFTHLDGAVRVFDKSEYEEHYSRGKAGKDIPEKIGQRHKLFLVEGQIPTELAQEILTEWFRGNPHIKEYFSGEVEEPYVTDEELEQLKSKI